MRPIDGCGAIQAGGNAAELGVEQGGGRRIAEQGLGGMHRQSVLGLRGRTHDGTPKTHQKAGWQMRPALRQKAAQNLGFAGWAESGTAGAILGLLGGAHPGNRGKARVQQGQQPIIDVIDFTAYLDKARDGGRVSGHGVKHWQKRRAQSSLNRCRAGARQAQGAARVSSAAPAFAPFCPVGWHRLA